MAYLRAGSQLVVCPINAGSDRTPAWWLNLRAAGKGVVVLEGERQQVRPRVAQGAEHERLWPEFVQLGAVLDDYRNFTTREIPLVILERSPAENSGALSGPV